LTTELEYGPIVGTTISSFLTSAEAWFPLEFSEHVSLEDDGLISRDFAWFFTHSSKFLQKSCFAITSFSHVRSSINFVFGRHSDIYKDSYVDLLYYSFFDATKRRRKNDEFFYFEEIIL